MKENKIMNQSYQKCRICHVTIPSGFTNCDVCYVKGVLSDEKTFHTVVGRSKKTTSTLNFINQDKD
jgi:hypothetical protein